jgi:hypothetical protein
LGEELHSVPRARSGVHHLVQERAPYLAVIRVRFYVDFDEFLLPVALTESFSKRCDAQSIARQLAAPKLLVVALKQAL